MRHTRLSNHAHRHRGDNRAQGQERNEPPSPGVAPNRSRAGSGGNPRRARVRGLGAGMAIGINHVLKPRVSTHGCQHMVEIERRLGYGAVMAPEPQSIALRVAEDGRRQAIAGVPSGPDEALAALRFADQLRRTAEHQCQLSAEDARRQGASWRAIGEAVGGITPQGAEHRFSPAAKERRSKASKVEWASKERRAP
jgi:hypothetical protein